MITNILLYSMTKTQDERQTNIKNKYEMIFNLNIIHTD